jgi:hypothetical protein
MAAPNLTSDSARFLLHDEERYPKHKAIRIIDRSTVRHIAGDRASHMLRLASSLTVTGRCALDEISPFCVEAMYRSGITYAQRYNEFKDESDRQAFETIQAGLKVLGTRWKAAGKSETR